MLWFCCCTHIFWSWKYGNDIRAWFYTAVWTEFLCCKVCEKILRTGISLSSQSPFWCPKPHITSDMSLHYIAPFESPSENENQLTCRLIWFFTHFFKHKCSFNIWFITKMNWCSKFGEEKRFDLVIHIGLCVRWMHLVFLLARCTCTFLLFWKQVC